MYDNYGSVDDCVLVDMIKTYGNGRTVKYTMGVDARVADNLINGVKTTPFRRTTGNRADCELTPEELQQREYERKKAYRKSFDEDYNSANYKYAGTYTTTDPYLQANPLILLKMVTDDLERQGIKYFATLGYGEIVTDWHVHTSTDKKINFDNWLNTVSCNKKNLYCYHIKWQDRWDNYLLQNAFEALARLPKCARVKKTNTTRIKSKAVYGLHTDDIIDYASKKAKAVFAKNKKTKNQIKHGINKQVKKIFGQRYSFVKIPSITDRISDFFKTKSKKSLKRKLYLEEYLS